MKHSQTLFQLEFFCPDSSCKHAAYLFMQRPEFIESHQFQYTRSECAGHLRSQYASPPCLAELYLSYHSAPLLVKRLQHSPNSTIGF